MRLSRFPVRREGLVDLAGPLAGQDKYLLFHEIAARADQRAFIEGSSFSLDGTVVRNK